MKRHLLVLFACLFVVMIGFGITLPVLPFYVERLALRQGAAPQSVVLHVTLLTGIYALMQLFFAPIWGRWSDRIGRKPLILVGIAGYIVAQVMFGLSTSLWLLYVARILGGVLSSATIPVSAAYVVDMTTKDERSRGMAWLGTAASLGVVVGPALGGLLSRRNTHFVWRTDHFIIDSFSTPFFAAAGLGLVILCVAARWLPESLTVASPGRADAAGDSVMAPVAVRWRTLLSSLSPLLALALAAQLVLTMFEGTFALFAQEKFHFGPAQVGYVFVVCGLVMTVFQAGAVGVLAGKVSEGVQIVAGFVIMGIGTGLLALAQTNLLVFTFVGVLALGMALITPNVLALISKHGADADAGASLGIQNSANSLGQSMGPLLGGALFVWQINAPYLVGGALLLVVAIGAVWKRTLMA